LRISWLSFLVGVQAVATFGQSPAVPQFEAEGVLSYFNGNHVAPLAPGVLMLIRGNGLGPKEYCPFVPLGLGEREEPSPLLPNPNMDNRLIYPTTLCGVRVTVGATQAGLMAVQDQQIIFKVPRAMPIEGTAELRVTYLGESKAVRLPLGVAALSLDGVARVGMPVWIKVSLYDRALAYPFDPIPANFRCTEIAVRIDGKLLPRIPGTASQQIDTGSGSSLGPCGGWAYPGVIPEHRNRIPLHLQYRFDTPGSYEIKFQLDEGRHGTISSPWTPIEIQPGTPQDRAKWLAELSSHWPSDPIELVTDYLPSIMGIPDDQSLELLIQSLYHPDYWVRQFVIGGLRYWPDTQSSAAVAAAVRSRGATDAALRFLESKSRLTAADHESTAERAIANLRSNTPVLLRGAVTVLRSVVYDPKWQVEAGLRNRAGMALIEAADHVVASADRQTLYDFAGTLGGVNDERAREILLSFLDRRIALPSTISALSSKRVPEDLAALAHLAFVPMAGKDQELEIDILPQQLHSYYGDSALPYLETMVRSSVNSRVRMQCARLLIRLGRPSGFDFTAKAIEQDRSDHLGMRGYLQEQFAELRTADGATILAFAKARSNSK
jgi:hypothetical protein